MKLALEEAEKSLPQDVPVGAVLLDKNQKVISTGYNQREKISSLSSHAEIICLDKASSILKTWKLNECTLFVTLEPCLMCAGAIMQSRIKTLVFGAYSSSFENKLNFSSEEYFLKYNKIVNIQVFGGILEQKCSKVLKDFFSTKRA